MAPSHKINTLSRSLVRIPGNGSDTSARPLCLNLARTLTNTDGPLGPLVQQCLAQNQEAFRPIVPFGSSESREARPPSTGVTEPSKSPRREVSKVGKRSGEDEGEAERKRLCPTGSPNGRSVAVQMNSDVRVSVSDRSTFGESMSSADAATAVSVQPLGGNSASAGSSRPTLRPVSVISQLAETVQELQRKQEENEREKNKLKEEVELLNKKLATFREIFQDTGKLRAVLKRLNIRL